MGFDITKLVMPSSENSLPGRTESMQIPASHFVNGHNLAPPYPFGMQIAVFGMGCFWGAERHFWQQSGVYTTAVGYTGGTTKNPRYEEVCSGLTGHNEVVKVVFDPTVIEYSFLLKTFWESHNPTQGMRQGNDYGTQYRSGIYVTSAEQRLQAERSRDAYGQCLLKAGLAAITTEIIDAPIFYFAEAYHQQYLAKNPNGYCGLGGLGITCPLTF